MSFFEKMTVSAHDSGSVDAFGRWRTSAPVTLFDGRVAEGDQNLVFSCTTTNASYGAATTNLTLASCTLNVVSTQNVTVVRQSYKRFPYIPGKSQMILATGVLGAASGGITRRMGYFDTLDGIFLQQDGSEVSIVKRTSTSGTANDTAKVLQDDWNLDPLNGTGPSGLTLNLAKSQILVIDLEWLGVGRVRVGFNIDGETYYCHEFLHANRTSGVYMSTASLPIRYELSNNGAGSAATFECICATVISEGGTEILGRPFGLSAGTGSVSYTANGTIYAIGGIKLNANARSIAYPTTVMVMGTTTNDFFRWMLWRNPTVSGNLVWSTSANSAVSTFTGNTTHTVNASTGQILAIGVAYTQQTIAFPRLDNLQLEVDAGGTSIPLMLAFEPLSTMNIASTINWREVS